MLTRMEMMPTGTQSSRNEFPNELSPSYLRPIWGQAIVDNSKPNGPAISAWATDDHECCESNASLLKSTKEPLDYSLLTKCLAEFIGVTIFVFVGTMQGYLTSGHDDILHAAFAHGLTIFIVVATLGHISGGHFNPAVSWGASLAGILPVYHLLPYVFAQLAGGLCGALLTVAILSKKQYMSMLGGATLLSADSQWYEGLISETVVSFLLMHTILNTAMDTNSNVLAPLAIGMTLTIDILATGKVTGASMNPARSFGPNAIGYAFLEKVPDGWWEYHYIYWAGPLMGMSIAAGVFWMFQARVKRLVK